MARPLNNRPSSGRQLNYRSPANSARGGYRGWSGDTTPGKGEVSPVESRKFIGHTAGNMPRLEAPQIERKGPVPYQYRLPPIAELKDMETAVLVDTLQRFGIVKSWEGLRIEAAKYVERISERTWTPEALKLEAETLVARETDAGLRRMAKTIYRETSAYESLDGEDPREVEYMWLGEGDSSQCDYCAFKAGTIATMAEFVELGMPGGETCAGGADCRCELVRMS